MEIECFIVRSRYTPLKAQDLLYVPPVLTFRYSVFCPQRIYLFLRGSQNKQRLYLFTALTDW